MLQAGLDAVSLQAKLFRGFSDSSRLAILLSLRDGPRSVGDIVTATGLSQSNTSNHLACLRECALVKAEQDGRFVRYSISHPEVITLLRTTEKLLGRVADEIYECANQGEPRRARRAE